MAVKNFVYYISTMVILFALVTVLRGWIDLFIIPFWIGGLIGVFLPEVDHFIYAYFLRPHEYNSQRIQRMVQQGQIVQSVQMGTETRDEHQSQVFHSIIFQLIFTVFAVFVVTSTGSLLGRGIVIGFLINLVVDQYLDLKRYSALENWFRQTKLNLTREQASLYVLGHVVAIFVLAFML